MRKQLGERNNDFHGHNKNRKNGVGENKFSPSPFFLFFPDAMHPVGGVRRRARGRRRFPALHRHIA